MSWLGGSLSSFTDQISNLTKDILTEGTEEVSDPVTELKLAQAKIQELEILLSSQKAENERVKLLIREAEERAEASELQVNSISSQYRDLLQQRQDEIKELKQRHHELESHISSRTGGENETNSHTAFHSAYSNTAGISNTGVAETFPDDEHDFGDSISMQHEINRLSKEVHRLQSECAQWKRRLPELGGEKTVEVKNDDSDINNITGLQTEIKRLQHELVAAREQHQQEVVALQDHHRSQLATLKHKHQAELEHVKEENAELDQPSASDISENTAALQDELKALKQQLLQLSDEKKGLKTELETTVKEKDQATMLLSQLESQSFKVKSRSNELETMVSSLQQEVTGLKSERTTLLENIDKLEQSIKQQTTDGEDALRGMDRLDEENKQVRADLYDVKETLLDQLDSNHAYVLEVLGDLRQVRHQLDSETVIRQKQVLLEKEKLVNLLIAAGEKKSELVKEVTITEQSKQQLNFDTRDAVQSVGNLQNQEAMQNLVTRFEEQNTELKERLVEKDHQIKDLEATVSSMKQEKRETEEKQTEGLWDISIDQTSRPIASTPYMKERSCAESNSEDQGSELRHMKSQLSVYREQIEEYECMKADWQVEKEALEDVLMGLRKQLREKEAAILKAKSSPNEIGGTEKEKQDTEGEMDLLLSELDEVKKRNAALQKSLEDSKGAMLELEKLKESLDEKTSEVLNLTAEKAELEAGLEELDCQHTEAMTEVIRIRDGLMEQAESLKHQISEKDGKIGSLTREVAELQTVANESLQSAADVSHDRSEVSVELEKMRLEYEKLKAERDSQSENLNGLSLQLENADRIQNELRMDNQELEGKVKQKETEVSEIQGRLIELKNDCETAEKAYQSTMEKLQLAEQELEVFEESSAFDSSRQENLETELESLKCQLNESVKEGQAHQALISELQTELNLSREEVTGLQKGKAELEEKFKETVKNTGSVQVTTDSSEVTALRSENQKLYTNIEALRSEKGDLEKELDQLEQKLQHQHKNYENYIRDMQKSQALDASSLQEEHNKSMQISHEKDMKISQLEEEILELKGELSDCKDTVQSAVESQQQLSGLVSEKEAEILNLKRENLHLSEKIEQHEKNVSDLELQVGNMEATQNQLSRSREENQKLRDELLTVRTVSEESSMDSDKMEARTLDVMTDMESELTLTRTKVKEWEAEGSRLNELVTDQETSIRELNEKTHQQGKQIQEYEDKVSKQDDIIAVLRQNSLQKDSEISDVKHQLKRATSLIEADKLYMLEQPFEAKSPSASLPAIEYPEKGSLDLDETEIIGSSSSKIEEDSRKDHHSVLNGQLSDDWSDDSNDTVSAEIEQLQHIIKEKDQVISELQNSNSSFLKMLESKSLTSGGDKTLVDVHKLENEVRALKTEREQILSVMNEKSRESSKLKSEVHRLMNIISAEKTALDKLTQDNNHLIRKRESSPNEDMQKEALQNLSRIIRDKDLEIESLTQKNQTLLQVLQDSSQEGGQINSLIVEKENLTKQLAVIQNERDQMVAFVNQKHQESVAYHNEVQRLTAYINAETEKFETTQRDYANLVPEFEDKKQALLKAQNELINYKQKYSELEVKYGELVQRSNVADTVDASTYNMKAQEASKLQERLMHCQQALQAKEGKINSLNQRISEFELSANSLEAEKNNYKKQVEHLSFQMQSLRREVEVVRQDSVDTEQGKVQQTSEMQLLRETNDKVMLSFREKEYEVNMLKEKCSTLTAMLQQKDGQEGQLDRLLRDNEAVNQQAQQFQQEKDQLMVVLRQRQTETDQLREQVEKQRQKEQKLNGELDRLRNHLLQIEDGYTQEALAAEEREKELRNRLASVEEKLASSSAAVDNVNLHAGQQLESLQQQLVAIASQRDAAYHQVALLQEQCQQYTASLANLQLVLEQFQQDRETSVATETERYRSQIASLTSEVTRLRAELADTQFKLDEASDGLEAAARLSEQLDKKEATIGALRDEVQLREDALKKSEDEKKQLATTSEAKVDKILVKNLVVGYLSTPQTKRNEALRVIGVVLNFSQEDFMKVVGDSQGSWIPGFLRFGRPPTTPPHTPTRTSPGGLNKSFSELFVKFLEKESSPPPPVMHLPAEQMAEETRQKQKEKEKEEHSARSHPQFNPFTAPRHAVMPIQVGGRSSPHDSHLLISTSLSPSLPMVAPLSTQEGAVTVTPVLPGQAPLPSSSAILKDVLGTR